MLAISVMGREIYVTPRLIANWLNMHLKGIKMRKTWDEDEMAIPIDYEVPADYDAEKLKASSFTQRGKQANELLTKIILPKKASTGICSKFKGVLMHAVTQGRNVNLPVVILNHIKKTTRHMIYGHLIIEICRAYKIYVEAATTKFNIELKFIHSKLYYNKHFESLIFNAKDTCYQTLQPG